MSFLTPWALAALPLALLPLLLAWHGRRSGEPVRFSSLYLVERARERARRAPTRSRWIVLLRCAVLALLVLAAARPVGPGAGEAALHRPTRAIVAVDVSASVLQRVDGEPAWRAIAAAADSVLAAASPDDRMALAAVADGLTGWWEAAPGTLRRRLADLEPTARPSDWSAALEALARREAPGSETYLVVDGSIGARGPGERRYDVEPSTGGDADPPRRLVFSTGPAGEANRALGGVRGEAPGRIGLFGRAWGPSAPEVAEAGRRVGERLVETAAIPLDGSVGGAAWSVPDTATFALAGNDPLAIDDAWRVASGAGRGAYRVGRWAPADEPPDPGPLFWEAALEALDGGRPVVRYASLEALARAAPDLAVVPISRYSPTQAALLADLAAAGTRLVFVPACALPGCAPGPGWMPPVGPDVPDLRLRMAAPDRATTLSPRPEGPDGPAGGVPAAFLDRAPVRGSLVPVGPAAATDDGVAPGWRWELRSGAPAWIARGSTALWLLPLGPPATRLAETPIFPMIVDAALAAWDPRWRAGAGGATAGRPLPVPAGGATVTGPVGATAPRTWRVAPGDPPPRAERVGFYRVEPDDVRGAAPAANFVAVNGDPAEGNLTPVPASAWSAWGRVVTTREAFLEARFPRRRGADLWPWLLALALAGLAAEARLARGRREG